MKTEVMTITPEMAKEMLRGNQRNRPLKKNYVRVLSDEMKARKWALNGVPIIFNGKLLIDGQHRLEACVHSGCSFATLVVSDVDADAFTTIDTGKKRSAADTLATKGEKHYSAMAAAATIVYVYYNGDAGEKARFTGKSGNNRLMAEVLKTYPALRHSVSHCISRSTKILPISLMCAAHYIFTRTDAVLADNFIERLASGNDVKAGSPMEELRSRLIDNYTSSRKRSRGYIFSMVIKAWNAERTGRNVIRLRGWTGDNNEAFPVAL